MSFGSVFLALTRPRAHRYSAEVSKNIDAQEHQEKQLKLMKEKYEAAVAQVQKNLERTKAALPDIHTRYQALLAKEKEAAEKAAKKAGAKTWDAAERIIKALPPAAKPEEDEDDGWNEVFNKNLHTNLAGEPREYEGCFGTFYQTYGRGRGAANGCGGYWVKEGGSPVYDVSGSEFNQVPGKLVVRLANESAGEVAAVRLSD